MRLQKDILGKEILDNEGNIIGKVKDIEIDTSTMKISFLVASKEVKRSGFSLTKGNTPEDEKIPVEEVGRIGDKIILKESLSDILNNL